MGLPKFERFTVADVPSSLSIPGNLPEFLRVWTLAGSTKPGWKQTGRAFQKGPAGRVPVTQKPREV